MNRMTVIAHSKQFVTQVLIPTVRLHNPSYREKLNAKFKPVKAEHGPSHSTDFNFPLSLSPTMDRCERRSDSNLNPHHWESNTIDRKGKTFSTTALPI